MFKYLFWSPDESGVFICVFLLNGAKFCAKRLTFDYIFSLTVFFYKYFFTVPIFNTQIF